MFVVLATVEGLERNSVDGFIHYTNIYWVSIIYRQLLGIRNTVVNKAYTVPVFWELNDMM